MKKQLLNNKGKARPRYLSPSAEVIDVNVQGVLCQSGNDSPTEEDWGDGGFGLGGKN